MSVARQVTRLATGLPPGNPTIRHIRNSPARAAGRPAERRPAVRITRRHGDSLRFPVDGEYLIKVRLQRQYQDYLKGMGWPQQLDIRLDGKLVKRFDGGWQSHGPPRRRQLSPATVSRDFAGDDAWEKYMQVEGDAGLEVRVPVKAGPTRSAFRLCARCGNRKVCRNRCSAAASSPTIRCTWSTPTSGSVQIGGPLQSLPEPRKTRRAAARFSSASRKPLPKSEPAPRRFFRRWRGWRIGGPVPRQDLPTLVEFFDDGPQEGGSFDAGIQFALERMLVDPDFLLRVYRDPPKQSVRSGRLLSR